MNTPSPNSMKRDPGRGSAYLSFLKKRCRDFFFFCLLLGVYVAFITLTGIGYNLLWVTLGNTLSGVVFMGLGYWYATPRATRTAMATAAKTSVHNA